MGLDLRENRLRIFHRRLHRHFDFPNAIKTLWLFDRDVHRQNGDQPRR